MSDLTTSWKAAAVLSAAFASGTVAALVWKDLLQSNSNKAKPQKWIKVGTVGEVMIYPVKSCQGLNVEEATATEIGFQVTDYFRDRIFMVVNPQGDVQRQTHLPKMTQIEVNIHGNEITLSAADADSIITFPIPEDSAQTQRSCTLYGEQVKSVLDCGPEVNDWLSQYLGTDVSLCYHHQNQTQRHKLTDSQKQFEMFSKYDKGSFQDETSFMFVSQESIAELNKRLDSPVTYMSFRPNILIEGVSEPFAEDFWSFVRIGDETGPVFKASQPCLRCRLTNIDPVTGDVNKRGDPLRTIHKMKRKLWSAEMDQICRTQAVFGLHLGLYQPGRPVKKGDPVYAAVL